MHMLCSCEIKKFLKTSSSIFDPKDSITQHVKCRINFYTKVMAQIAFLKEHHDIVCI